MDTRCGMTTLIWIGRVREGGGGGGGGGGEERGDLGETVWPVVQIDIAL